MDPVLRHHQWMNLQAMPRGSCNLDRTVAKKGASLTLILQDPSVVPSALATLLKIQSRLQHLVHEKLIKKSDQPREKRESTNFMWQSCSDF